MSWYAGRSRLKMTGHPSPQRIDEIASSSLVDVAYVVEATPEVVYFVADDPGWPADSADFDWLCSVIRETLAQYGIGDVELSVAPPAPDGSDA